jgi:RalA-binding protein 1
VNVKGKEGWKIEKLYSDVLSLDTRVRALAGKSLGKKLSPLPDSKLFKDNAPAKVDLRKVRLYS